MKALLLLLLTCIAAASSAQQPVQQKTLDDLALQLAIEKLSFNSGERFRYTLFAEMPKNVVVNFEAVDETLGPFKIISRHPSGPTALENGNHRWQRKYVLEPELLGELAIPSLELAFYTMDKPFKRVACLTADACPRFSAHDPGPEIKFAHTRRDMRTDVITVTVTALPVQEQEQDTQNSPTITKALFSDITLIALTHWWVVPLIVITVLTLFLHRRRKTANNAESQPVAQAITATANVNHKLLDDLIAQQRISEFYDKLNELIRQYLSQYTATPLLSKTSEELLSVIQHESAVVMNKRDALRHLLQHCDLVRFAGIQPNTDNINNDLQNSKVLLQNH